MTSPCIFRIGDRVADLDGDRPGIVTQIGEWSASLGCYRVKVAQFDGPTHWRNESSLQALP